MADSVLSSVLPNNSVRGLIPRMEESTVYVENESNLAQKEDLISNNDVIMTFTSGTLGATSVFRLSKAYQFLGSMFVRFKLAANVAARTFLSDYPAYSFIKTIKYIVGSTEQLIMYQENMLDFLHEQCEDNDEKKVLMHELAGYKVLPISANGYYLYAFLPMPWSSIKGNKLGQNQKPFPIHALNDNIELQIQLNDYLSVSAGEGAKFIEEAALLFKYTKIGNHQQLIKEKIRYPFKQVINTQQFQITNSTLSDNPQVYTNYLTNFRKGECTDLLIHLSDGADVFRGLPLKNLELFFNGVRIWNANNSDRCWDLITADQPSTYGKKRLKVQTGVLASIVAGSAGAGSVILDANNVLLANAGGIGNYIEVDAYASDVAVSAVTTDVKNYYYGIPLGEIRMKMLESGNNYALSGDFSRQSLQIKFTTPIIGAGVTNILYVGYNYTGIYEIDEYGSCILAF